MGCCCGDSKQSKEKEQRDCCKEDKNDKTETVNGKKFEKEHSLEK